MTKFTMTHEINCSPETFWKLYFDKDMNTSMYRDGLGFTEYQIVEQRDTDAETFRKVAATPKLNLPAALQKVLGSNFRYTEETRFDKATKTARYTATPSTLADKTTNTGVIRAESAGPNKTRRITEITMEARVMLIGGLMESTFEKEMRDGWGKGADYMNKWIKDKGLEGT